MKNRALIGLSAACMSALVATAVGCGEPIHEPYTPPEKDAVEQAQPAADKAEEEKAAADLSKEEAENPNAGVADAADEAEASVDEKVAADEEKAADEADGAAKEAEGQAEDEAASEAEKVDAQEGDKAGADAEADNADKAAAEAGYADGEYTATGKGIGGDVPVTVTVKDGKISDVTVGDNSETQGIGSKAIEQLPAEIVKANGTEGVDAVSGATITSKAIFSAVDECLAQAGEGSAAPANDAEKVEAPAGYADGTYEATGKGIGGDVPVTVEVKDGKIASVTVGDNSETQGIGSKAIEQLPEAIVAAGGTEGVDGVSGATITSKAIFSAVDECLAQASSGDAAADAATDEKVEKADESLKAGDETKAEAEDAKKQDEAVGEEVAKDAQKVADDEAKADAEADNADKAAAEAGYADGEYTATGKGIGGDVPVTVTVKDGKISDVTVGDNSETQGIGSKAIEQLPAEIVKANGTEGVDAVSGATITSKAIFSAVDECLAQAGEGSAAPANDAEKVEAPAGYADGTYEATGKGIGGDVPVTVEVKDGKIASVTVGDNSETQGIGSKAIEQLPEAIVAAGGTEGVDGVSGATITSKAIFSAVDECLAQASSGDAAADAATDEKVEKADESLKAGDETKAEAEDAKKQDEAVGEEVAKDAQKVADDEAKADAEADNADKAAAEAGYADGEYTATGKGIGGDVPVTVTVKDGKISDVTVGDNSETQGIGSKAIEQLPAEIVKANGTEGVDAVSGATITSKAIFSAVDECLAQASSGDAAADAATDEKAEPAADADKKDDAKADEKAEPAADAKADDQKAEPAPDAKADSTAAVLADGEYTATGKGIGGDVPVTVTVKDGKISEVTVGDNSETQGIGSKAIEQLPALIVENNGTDGIDGISGATITSKAIFSAVNDAVAQASSGDVVADAAADQKAEPAADVKADDQKAEPAADADKKDDAKVDDKKTEDKKAEDKAEPAADADKKADDQKADEKAEPAADAKADDQKAEPAADDAKAEAGALKDGTYEAEGKGIGGKVPVTVVVKDGKVSEVTVGDNSETQGIGSKAVEQLPEAIVAAGGTEGVDGVSGATITSKAIFSAVEDALAQAGEGGAAADEKAEPAADVKADDQKAEPAADADKKDDAKVDDKKAEDKKAEDKAEPAADADKKADDQKADEKAEPAADAKADDQKAEPAADTDKKADAKAESAATDKKADAKAESAATDKKADAKAESADAAKKADDKKADEAAAGLKDGEYTAEGKGIGGKVPVTVVVKDGAVAEVTVGDNSETQGIGSKAIEQLPELIVKANGTEGVDGVSGATITSKAIFSAVEDCLKQAEAPADKADDKAGADKKDAKAEAGALKDGTYEAEGKGIGGKVPVTVVVKDGKVSEVTVGDNSETQGIGSKAVEQLPALIVEANGTEGVDGVSGATITSKAIFSAVEDALAQAQA